MANFIATVGHQKFLLPTDEEAFALLKLLSGAQPVDEHYMGSGSGYVYSVDKTTISVEIVGDIKVLTARELEALRQDAKNAHVREVA